MIGLIELKIFSLSSLKLFNSNEDLSFNLIQMKSL